MQSKKTVFIIILAIIAVVALILFVSPPFKTSQPATPKRIGVLTASDLQLATIEGIRAGVKELGLTENKDFVIELRNPKGDLNLVKTMATDIVVSKPDLIVSVSTSASSAMKEADDGAKIPVVAVDVGNFAQLGVENIQHPGGFMTGVIVDNVVTAPKRMEILKTLLPKLKTVGILANPENVSYGNVIKIYEEAAGRLGLRALWYNVTKKEDILAAMQKMIRDDAGAFMTVNDAVISGNSNLIVPPLKQAKIPSIDFNVERGVSSGYLMVYGAARFDVGKQGARMIYKVMQGEKPGDIPVEFFSALTFEINTALAREMDVKIPESLLLQASKVYNQ